MYRASVVIPVYNAAGTLERCVESLVYGKERNLEIILVEDRSRDNSWEVCQLLAGKYPNVKALRNEKNSGVSHTRNRGLEAATGEYILFVDSDDWVSGDYAAVLLDEAEKDPKAIPVCGFHYLNQKLGTRHGYIWDIGSGSVRTLGKERFFELVGKVLLQSPFNKAFCREVIVGKTLRFDENQAMGEDFQFVLDYLETADCERIRVIDQALYYYIRTGTGSLMGKFGLVERENEYNRLKQLRRICGDTPDVQLQYKMALESVKNGHIYHAVRALELSKTQKLEIIASIWGHEKAETIYRKEKWAANRENLCRLLRKCARFPGIVRGKIQTLANRCMAVKMRRTLIATDFTVISQNCTGGVLYHDMGMKFLSPTVNLYFSGPDFVQFVDNLKHYLSIEPIMVWEEEYPVGKLENINVHFMHYDSCTQALDAWKRRRERVNYHKILVLCSDRECFTPEVFSQWQRLSYKKILFTAREAYRTADSLYYPQYRNKGFVPDLIPKREFYKGNVVIRTLNELEYSEE